MAAEVSNFAVSDVRPPVVWEAAPKPMTIFPRNVLRRIMDVRVDRWLLPSDEDKPPYWRLGHTLAQGLIASNDYEDPYTVCFVPLPEGMQRIGDFPVIGGPRIFDQRAVGRNGDGLFMDIVQPRSSEPSDWLHYLR